MAHRLLVEPVVFPPGGKPAPKVRRKLRHGIVRGILDAAQNGMKSHLAGLLLLGGLSLVSCGCSVPFVSVTAASTAPSSPKPAPPTPAPVPVPTPQPPPAPPEPEPDPPLPNCPNEEPICDGGLLLQTADAAAINEYMASYDTQGCRFIEPPRCSLYGVKKCQEECTS